MSIFGDVDGLGGADRASRYLERISALPAIERGKRARDALLGLRVGSSVLDVGCGLGVDVRRMAPLVGRTGRSVGVDVSRDLLERAQQLPGGDKVTWRVADATRLPYPDGEFDAVRIERTLEHLADPGAAVSEAVRVTRPGGRVCLCEPDWATLVVGGVDPASSDAVRDVMAQTVRHPYVGRDLLALVETSGPAYPPEVYAEVVVVQEDESLAALMPTALAGEHVAREHLRTTDARGALIAMLTMVTVLVRC